MGVQIPSATWFGVGEMFEKVITGSHANYPQTAIWKSKVVFLAREHGVFLKSL